MSSKNTPILGNYHGFFKLIIISIQTKLINNQPINIFRILPIFKITSITTPEISGADQRVIYKNEKLTN